MQFEMLKDNIGVWHEAMPRYWCEEVIRAFDKKRDHAYNDLQKVGWDPNGDHLGFAFRDNEKRVDESTVFQMFASWEPYEHALKVCLEACVEEYWHEIVGKHTGERGPWGHYLEHVECKIQKTPPGGGFSKWHYEQGPDYHCSRRFGVWMIYLNDVNKGGKTDFPNQGLSVTPEAGKMVIWPAAYTHTHRSAPDLEEWKYIVTGWFIYKSHDDSQNDKDYEVSRIRKSSS